MKRKLLLTAVTVVNVLVFVLILRGYIAARAREPEEIRVIKHGETFSLAPGESVIVEIPVPPEIAKQLFDFNEVVVDTNDMI